MPQALHAGDLPSAEEALPRKPGLLAHYDYSSRSTATTHRPLPSSFSFTTCGWPGRQPKPPPALRKLPEAGVLPAGTPSWWEDFRFRVYPHATARCGTEGRMLAGQVGFRRVLVLSRAGYKVPQISATRACSSHRRPENRRPGMPPPASTTRRLRARGWRSARAWQLQAAPLKAHAARRQRRKVGGAEPCRTGAGGGPHRVARHLRTSCVTEPKLSQSAAAGDWPAAMAPRAALLRPAHC